MPEFNENESFELSDYDPAWPRMFQEEAPRIAEALGEEVVEIEHVGSTSVPGLRAKPIIDILVAVETFSSLEVYKRKLAPIGYTHHPHINDAERLFFWKGVPRTHHLHIVEYATWEHQRHIIFRDYLRAHPEIARLYTQVKEQLAQTFHHNRPAYTRGKTAFISAIMDRAMAEIVDPSLRELVDAIEQQLADDEAEA